MIFILKYLNHKEQITQKKKNYILTICILLYYNTYFMN